MTAEPLRYPDLGLVLDILAGAGYEVDPLDVADACWLAKVLPAPPEAPPVTETTVARAPDTPPAAQPPRSTSVSFGVTHERTGGTAHSMAGRYHARGRGAGGGSLVILPDAPALPEKLALGRALRPLRRLVNSATRSEVDLVATANMTAVRRLAWDAAPLEPVFRPARTRWLDAVLLVDRSQSMAVWRRTVEEWTQSLHYLGAFRDLRVWHLVGDAGRVALVSPGDDPAHPRALHDIAELADPSGRRLVLIASDCVGPLWSTTAMVRFLETQAAAGPLAILQLLPPHMWRRTALARSSAFALSASAPGLPPRALDAVALDLDAPRGTPARRPLAIPVVPLRAGALAAWVQLMLGMRNGRSTGYTFATADTVGHAAAGEPMDTARLVGRFIDASGTVARRLAVHLAAVPLTKPVMRLVRQEIVPEAREEHLVEVLFSGLVAQRIPDLWIATAGEELFDFHPGVRELLLEGMSDSKIKAIAREIGAYLERTQGAAYNYAAMLDISAEQGDAVSRPFATVSAALVQTLHGASTPAAIDGSSPTRPATAASPLEQQRRIQDLPRYPDATELEDIQGIVYRAYVDHQYAGFLFARLGSDARASRAWLDTARRSVTPTTRRTRGPAKIHIALSSTGLARLGVPSRIIDRMPPEMVAGMGSRAALLDDYDPDSWQLGSPGAPLDVLVMVYARDPDVRAKELAAQRDGLVACGADVYSDELTWPLGEIEHFGFSDGVSQLYLPGFHSRRRPGEKPVAAGEILLGYPDADGQLPKSPTWGGFDLGRNGTYLVFRKLEQHVAAFWSSIASQANVLAGGDVAAADYLTELIAAKLVGRWRSGAPLAVTPDHDDPMYSRPETRNVFGYGDDPYGMRCPVWSHVRRANPRDDRGSSAQSSEHKVIRHPILRRGRSYGARLASAYAKAGQDDGASRGMYFICLQSSIVRGFESIQRGLHASPGTANGCDPLLGSIQRAQRLLIPADPVPLQLAAMPTVVTHRGGGYFFLPSLTALARIVTGP